MILPTLSPLSNQPPWPPPPWVKAILRRARGRWRRLPLHERPGTTPAELLHVFSLDDVLDLQLVGLWPLSAEAIRYIRTPPAAPQIVTEGAAA
jgi:hypothetical protein